MKYRKNIGLFLLIGCILCNGCGVNPVAADVEENERSQTSSTIEQTNSQTIEERESQEETEEIEIVPYAYEHECNIIDDNYRNYYEIFVYSFFDSDQDGIGDINGVTEKLDYIEEMGFNGIWLMPIFSSTTYHKYDVVDYTSIDPEYGTMDDFKKMLDECHQRGIHVVIDFVINHSSSQHEWFLQATEYIKSLSGEEEPDLGVCPYVEYYHFSKEKKNNTYYPVSGSNGWYYEGSFWSEMPDLNLESEALRKEIEQIADQWIEMGVDGFRMDAPLHFEEGDTSFNTETLQWLYEYCLTRNSNFYMVSEVWANEKTIADYYQSGTPSMFNFDVADTEGKIIKTARGTLTAQKFVEAMLKYEEDFSAGNPNYIDAPFITNHDMGRVANVLQSDEINLKMAGGLLMTMNGSPFVYYGEEIGMKSSGKKDENKRLPMLWSSNGCEGMTTGPKDADSGIESNFSGVEEQLQDDTSILKYYQRAIRIRNENPEIARGKIQVVDELTKDHIAVITKEYEGKQIAICYNTGEESKILNLIDSPISEMTLRGYLTVDQKIPELQENELEIPGKSIVFLK